MASTPVADWGKAHEWAEKWAWRSQIAGGAGAISALVCARLWAFKSLGATLCGVSAFCWFQIQECGRMAKAAKKLQKKKRLVHENLGQAARSQLYLIEKEKRGRLWQHGLTVGMVVGMGLLLTRYVTVGLGLTFASMSLLAPLACHQRLWKQEKKIFGMIIDAKAGLPFLREHKDLVRNWTGRDVESPDLPVTLKSLKCDGLVVTESFATYKKLKAVKAGVIDDIGFRMLAKAPILEKLSVEELMGDQQVLLKPPERVRRYKVQKLPEPKGEENPFELLHKLRELTIELPEEGCLEALIRSKKELDWVKLKQPFNVTRLCTGEHLPKRVVVHGFQGDFSAVEKNYDFYIGKAKVRQGSRVFNYKKVTLVRKGYGLSPR